MPRKKSTYIHSRTMKAWYRRKKSKDYVVYWVAEG